jgi:hypothetical protein
MESGVPVCRGLVRLNCWGCFLLFGAMWEYAGVDVSYYYYYYFLILINI